MPQVTFASDAEPDLPDLDANFTDLYDLRELISTPGYTASVPRLAVDGSGNWTAGANFASTSFTAGTKFTVGATNVRTNCYIAGDGIVASTVPVNAGQSVGGVLVLVTGADAGGTAFSRLYLIALRLSGGGTPDVTAVLVSTSGSATPTFSFSNVSGFLNMTVASGNITYAHFFGG